MKRLIASSPFVFLPDVRDITERAPFTQPRALADFRLSHQRAEDGERRHPSIRAFRWRRRRRRIRTSGAWGTICITTVQAVGRSTVLTTPSDGYTTRYML